MATRRAYLPIDLSYLETTENRQIMRRLGHKGFYACLKLKLLLLNEPGGQLPIALDEEWEDLAERLELNTTDVKLLVQLMKRYGDLHEDEGSIYSEEVDATLIAYNTITAKRQQAANTRWEREKRSQDLSEKRRQAANARWGNGGQK